MITQALKAGSRTTSLTVKVAWSNKARIDGRPAVRLRASFTMAVAPITAALEEVFKSRLAKHASCISSK